MATPHFLQALGLDDSADERAIRKAYAQRLKRIDQATEAPAFQDLREAYEVALRWAAWQRQQVAEAALVQEGDGGDGSAQGPAPQPDASPAHSPVVAIVADEPAPRPATPEAPEAAEAPPAAEALAEAVFQAFAARRDRVFDSEDSAREALDAALADDSLVNLEARAILEWRIARELVEGWQPGHEFLFGPACQAFHWEQERRRLGIYGRVGQAVNNAIEEKLLFFRQDALEFNQHRSLVQRLRRDEVPPAPELLEAMPRLQVMAQRFPHWLRIVTSQANYARWVEAYEAIPPQLAAQYQRKHPAPAAPPVAAQKPSRVKSRVSLWTFGIAIFLVIKLLSFLGDRGVGGSTPSYQGSRSPAAATDLGRRQREAEDELKRVLAEARRQRASSAPSTGQ